MTALKKLLLIGCMSIALIGYTQDLKYIGGTYPIKSVNDTCVFNSYFQFHKLFFAANDQRSVKYIDTLRYKSDSVNVTGTIQIMMWSNIIPDTLIHSATIFHTFVNGIPQSELTEFYCYMAYYEDGSTLLIKPNKSYCYGRPPVKPPVSVGDKQVCNTLD